MRTIAFLWLLLWLWLPQPAAADYIDPYGLPSGSASLNLATQAAIASGESVEAFDFTDAEMILAPYMDHMSTGLADLVFFELHPDSIFHYFRAPEGGDGFDRALIAELGPVDLEDLTRIEDVEFAVTAPVVDGDTYVMLQIQAEALPETTAVKFRVTLLGDTQTDFDWVLQPSGSLYFVPSASETMDFGELKRRW